jgi:drug/metabolite transporter (DMT)-like permease
MVCAPSLFSMAGVFTRHLESAHSAEVAFWRSLFAALFVAAVLLVTQGAGAWRSLIATGRYGLLSGAMWAIMFTAFMVALTLTTTANTLVMSSLSPLLAALLAWRLLGEPVPLRTRIAIAVAMAGMLWMFGAGFSADNGQHITGMLIALAVPFASAINIVSLRRSAARLDLVPAVFIGGTLSALATVAFALPFSASGKDMAILAFLGVFQLGLPCILMVHASRTLPAPQIALFIMLEVVLGPVWAWIGAGEVPQTATLAGSALVLAALLGNQLAGMRGHAGQRPGA